MDFKTYKGEKLVRDKVINELQKKPGTWHSIDVLAEWLIGPFYLKKHKQLILEWLHSTKDWRIEISGCKVRAKYGRLDGKKDKNKTNADSFTRN